MLTCPYSFTFRSPVALQQSQVAPMLIYNIFESVCQQSNPENMTQSHWTCCVSVPISSAHESVGTEITYK